MMKICFVMLLLALHMNTVEAQCVCDNTDTMMIETNKLFSKTIECTDSDAPFNCTLTLSGEAGTTMAVAFPNTQLDGDTANNYAKVTGDAGGDIVSVVSTLVKLLTSTTQSELNTVTIDIMMSAAGKLKFEYIAAVGADTTNACSSVGTAHVQETLNLIQDTCISSPNFPANYDVLMQCKWMIQPGVSGANISAEMRFMSVENSCPDGDPVTIVIDGTGQTPACSNGLQSTTFTATSSMDVNFLSDDSDTAPGFLMCFGLTGNPCNAVPAPCNGGTCTANADFTGLTCSNCPAGFTGQHCEIDVCGGNPCSSSTKTCKACPDCESPNLNKKCKKKCKRQRYCKKCKGKGKGYGKCKNLKMFYCE